MLLLILTLLTVQSSSEEFGAIRAFRCDFPEGVGRTAKEGGGLSNLTPEQYMGLVTHSIDYVGRTALASGAKGTATVAVTVTAGERATSFLMVSTTGNPMLKTIFALPLARRGADGRTRYFAALSSHGIVNGEAKAQQLYGTCEAVR